MDHSRSRRSLLNGLGVTAMGALVGTQTRDGVGADLVPYSSGREPPSIEVPAGACDSHMHIYDSRFPVAPSATLRPPDAKVADYRLLQKRLGTSRCIVVQPGRAELAFTVVDSYQGQCIGALLMRHLAAIARQAGIKELVAEVLADNIPMLRVFEKSGLDFRTRQEAGVVHVAFQLEIM